MKKYIFALALFYFLLLVAGPATAITEDTVCGAAVCPVTEPGCIG